MEISTQPTKRADWRDRAACRDQAQEMVPDDAQGILLAKKICAQCPVVSSCFAAAERITKTFGPDLAQGLWGGLTLAERNTLGGLGRPPQACPQCDLICVPVNYATQRCSVCDPQAAVAYDDYRPRIIEMIEAGFSYHEIAIALRLKRSNLSSACYRWKIKAKRSSKRGKRARKECGTLAAKERHRKHGESWQDCACRHVRWRKGKARPRPTREVNASQNVTPFGPSALMDNSKEVDIDTPRPSGRRDE